MEDGQPRFYTHPPFTQRSSMPTYEYMCKECGETIEVFQSFSDKPLKKHTECGGELKKVFHARGIVFKGSGFYATDSKTSTAAKTPSKGDGKSKSDSASNSKPKEAASTTSSDA